LEPWAAWLQIALMLLPRQDSASRNETGFVGNTRVSRHPLVRPVMRVPVLPREATHSLDGSNADRGGLMDRLVDDVIG
jgi:hypothetical protein